MPATPPKRILDSMKTQFDSDRRAVSAGQPRFEPAETQRGWTGFERAA